MTEETVKITALTPADTARILAAAGKRRITEAMVAADIAAGAPVNADGTISDLDIVQGNPNSILGMISADSIKQSSDLIGPFPADLKAEKPNGFPWQLAFRIY